MDIQEASTLAHQLINQHQLIGWRFYFDRAVRRAGCCHYRLKAISLSIHFTQRNTLDEVQDTILHEIAHAIAGFSHGHDYYWKQICRKIGANPNRCYDSKIVDMPTGKYQATCPTCSKVFHRHRRPKLERKTFCRNCGPIRGELKYKGNSL